MIRPVKSGEALAREIRDARPAAGAIYVWWLGQSGYCVSRGRTLYIDPYLSEHLTAKYAAKGPKEHIRITESPLRGREIADADFVLASHKHSDHMDPGTLPDLMSASPAARLVLPASLADYAADTLKLPADRMIPVDAGQSHDLAGIRLDVLPSAHEGLDRDELGRHLYLGFILEIDGLRIYHSGDTILYPGLIERLSVAPPAVAFLPINGRDARRAALGTSGNMTFEEVEQTCRSVRPAWVVPHHYDMFTFNTADVGAFVRHMAERLPEQRVRVLQCGERWTAK